MGVPLCRDRVVVCPLDYNQGLLIHPQKCTRPFGITEILHNGFGGSHAIKSDAIRNSSCKLASADGHFISTYLYMIHPSVVALNSIIKQCIKESNIIYIQ